MNALSFINACRIKDRLNDQRERDAIYAAVDALRQAETADA